MQPSSPADHALNTSQYAAAELITILYKQGHTALLGVIATAIGVSAIFLNEIPKHFIAYWFICIITLSFIRHLHIKKFKSTANKIIDTSRWGRSFAIFTFLSGVTWGSASIIFFTPENLQLFTLLTLIILAMSLGSLAALSAYPIAFYSFIIPTMLPMIWQYLYIHKDNYYIFGLLLFVFNFALVTIVRTNHRLLLKSAILQFKNSDLINNLRQEKLKAEQANISKTKFLAAASHDIRQPIHAIGLFIGVLEEKSNTTEQKNIIYKIKKSSDALNSLLNSLLDISKLDAGIIQINSEAININHLFSTLKNEFTPHAKQKKLTLKFKKTNFWVYSDFQILQRIFRNIISNAIKYTNKGGILIGCRRHQGKILIAVYDTGIGIDKSDIGIIFDEFHQLHNPQRDRSDGLGLGLAIVKRMSELLKISLYINSRPAKGSTFGIIIAPISAPLSMQISAVPQSNKIQLDHKIILIIDDEEDIRSSLSSLLESWNCQVVSSASSQQALELLTTFKPKIDLILADYRLADNETGLETIKKINAFYANSAIPAIIITGDTAPERIKLTSSSGYKTLHKPVAPAKLKALIKEVLFSHNE